jgi:hypothetical protein
MDYISREELRKHLKECYDNELFEADMRRATIGIDVYVENMPAADVQSLSVVAKHIKNRLYETALNTNEAEARNAIADMANRIDFWIDELKVGEQNG